MKKLLDSDWLRAVQFKCNTSAKSVIGNDQNFVQKLFVEKIFLKCEKKGFKKHLQALFPREFFHVCIINK